MEGVIPKAPPPPPPMAQAAIQNEIEAARDMIGGGGNVGSLGYDLTHFTNQIERRSGLSFGLFESDSKMDTKVRSGRPGRGLVH